MRRLVRPGRRTATFTALLFGGGPVLAAGLGAIELHSRLGEPFHARIETIGTPGSGSGSGCGTARIETLEGDLLAVARVSLLQAGGRGFLDISTTREISEPVLQVRTTLCGASLERTYQVLLDLPPQSAGSSKADGGTLHLGAAGSQPPAPAPASANSIMFQAGPRPAPSSDSPRPLHQTPPALQARTIMRAPRGDVLRMSAPDPVDALLTMHLPLALNVSRDLQPLSPPAVSEEEARTIHARFTAALGGLNGTDMPRAAAVRVEQAPRQPRADELRQAADKKKDILQQISGNQGAFLRTGLLWSVLIVVLAAAACLGWFVVTIRSGRRSRDWEILVAEDDEQDGDLYDLGEPQSDSPVSGSAARSKLVPRSDPIAHEHITTTASDGKRMSREIGVRATSSDTGCVDEEALSDGKQTSAPVAEEVSDLLEVIDMWTTLDHADKALELLAAYKDIERPASPIPWMGLLQVYAAMKDRDNYEAIAKRLKTAFNVKAPDWEHRDEWETPRTISDFPHVRQKIIDLWPTDQVAAYLKTLIVNDRHGERVGFDMLIFRDLVRLLELAENRGRTTSGDALLDENVSRILDIPSRQGPAPETQHETVSDLSQ